MNRLAVCLAVGVAAPAFAGDWPHWRGPTRDGVTAEPSRWVAGRAWLTAAPAWTASVGIGNGGALAVGGRVYVHGWEAGKDAVRCLDAADGKDVWKAEYKAPKYGRVHMGDDDFYGGPSATPEFDAGTGLLYTLGVDGGLTCWDTAAAGKKVWSLNLYDDYKAGRRPQLTRFFHRDYGYTASPLVHGDWLIVEVGSTARGSVVAFDKRTGKEVWASALKDEAGHTGGLTPLTVEGVPCVAVLTQRNLAVIRLDPANRGKTAAVFPWVTDGDCNIPCPAARGDHVLVTSAYNQSVIVKLKITLAGAEEVWRKKTPSKVCSPVIHGDSVYFSWHRVRCLDWETGDLRWEGGAFGEAGSCAVTADGRVVVYGHNGKLALVEGAGRSPKKYEELAVKDGIFKAFAWPHVALADGQILCRDKDGHLACFVLPK